MRLSFAWLLMSPWVFGANAPTFTYTLSGSGVGTIATDAAGNTYIEGNIYVAGTTSPPVGGVNTFPVTQGVAFATQPAWQCPSRSQLPDPAGAIFS